MRKESWKSPWEIAEPNITGPAREIMVFAIRHWGFDLGALLLKKQLVSVDTKDPKTGKTLLHVAARYSGARSPRSLYGWPKDATSAAFALIEQGADVNLRDRDGNTPLILACKEDPGRRRRGRIVSLRRASKFLSLGANPMLKNRRGCSAVGYALEKGEGKLVRLLLTRSEDGPMPNIPDEANNPVTRLRRAAQLNT